MNTFATSRESAISQNYPHLKQTAQSIFLDDRVTGHGNDCDKLNLPQIEAEEADQKQPESFVDFIGLYPQFPFFLRPVLTQLLANLSEPPPYPQ
jgi:hypothetical protein